MDMKCWAIPIGIGVAVGAIAVLALPKSNCVRKLTNSQMNLKCKNREVTDLPIFMHLLPLKQSHFRYESESNEWDFQRNQ